MSKVPNYYITIGGVIVMIGIVVFGSIKYIIFAAQDLNINKQVLDFLSFAIPAMLATALVMSSILNLVEKKELKAITKLSTKYQVENKEVLDRIEESLAIKETLDEVHQEDHKTINDKLINIKEWMIGHKIYHAKK